MVSIISLVVNSDFDFGLQQNFDETTNFKKEEFTALQFKGDLKSKANCEWGGFHIYLIKDSGRKLYVMAI